MSGEMFNAAVLSSTLILVGLGLGFLLLKIQGGEEEVKGVAGVVTLGRRFVLASTPASLESQLLALSQSLHQLSSGTANYF
jgi:cytochrome b6-f complex subunit 7